MAYEHTNSKGVKYYLHETVSKRDPKVKIYYFCKNIRANACNKPDNFSIIENAKTGLPLVKKIR